MSADFSLRVLGHLLRYVRDHFGSAGIDQVRAESGVRDLEGGSGWVSVQQFMEPVIVDVVAKTPRVIERVGATLPRGFPMDLFDSVTTGLQKAATKIERMPPC